ncbi:MAG TPA: STAS domain-containing protein [Spirochaetota bacterium]|nr:STAS domain-containing protein [Spirochaetota bacterium]HPC41514.1 STAS domain-containing protein [Spirochaetota bacterium]HPL15599.1 STAS domain-containing protein [Spirochaetota bacterium]HQF09118.1 STAS domain-containing protein [Spirochaetota bacterium]HQH97657.1 STAS domain-containing protein [Spirochaetota bacterium]
MENISFEEKGNKIVVTASGEWNLGNIKDMEVVFTEILAKKPGMIAINCKNLNGVDSTAIASLVKILRKTKEMNIKLIFFDLSPNIYHTFELMTLNKFFTIMTRQRFDEEFGG